MSERLGTSTPNQTFGQRLCHHQPVGDLTERLKERNAGYLLAQASLQKLTTLPRPTTQTVDENVRVDENNAVAGDGRKRLHQHR
jgi:hypothetical protein